MAARGAKAARGRERLWSLACCWRPAQARPILNAGGDELSKLSGLTGSSADCAAASLSCQCWMRMGSGWR